MKQQQARVYLKSIALCLLTAAVSSLAAIEKVGVVNYAGLARNLIYDSVQNLTWLDYTNAINPAFPQAAGTAFWPDHKQWAKDLSFTFNGILIDDWRLPTMTGETLSWGYDGTTTEGYNITSSELGHLFYSGLGNKGYYDSAGNPQSGYGLTNTGPFEHLITYFNNGLHVAEYAVDGPLGPFRFNFAEGKQDDASVFNGMFAIAVRTGDMTTAPSPVPDGGSTSIMLGFFFSLWATARATATRYTVTGSRSGSRTSDGRRLRLALQKAP